MTNRNAGRLALILAVIAVQLLVVSCTNKTATSQTAVTPVSTATAR